MECKWRKLEQPKYLKRWVDLAAVCGKHWGKKGNLRASVEAAGLAWEGRAHSAIDDARNTARWGGRQGGAGAGTRTGGCGALAALMLPGAKLAGWLCGPAPASAHWPLILAHSVVNSLPASRCCCACCACGGAGWPSG